MPKQSTSQDKPKQVEVNPAGICIDQNKIDILLNEYGNFYLGVVRTEALLIALKKLPEDMILEKNQIVPTGPGFPPTMRNKSVKDRIEEVDRDYKVLTARLEATKEMLESIPGGAEALKTWQWKPQPNE